jgi:hypothetical protein
MRNPRPREELIDLSLSPPDFDRLLVGLTLEIWDLEDRADSAEDYAELDAVRELEAALEGLVETE